MAEINEVHAKIRGENFIFFGSIKGEDMFKFLIIYYFLLDV